ncbi:hypothetical protein GUITHDRAFT_153361 [Guillardia theta CCMP2712]|uniref:Uncharacterized protein n=1 Tax=Guillardia theta (strain CCMP2712) TaxID=905079 RepID=L1J4S7_GUITC|nr:hypothetical protein GUITHDRAFT_153361 [Guillardia theta CCMP2712]EKX43134.1 hypothetical protein GUITHDRAFT_153361 [Guillardia theta CCMP2712]|eukprot:XP_005830114.1 hypothetical protein GUITHDRAFT_153361 [Guillardia theta CCMP2712]
MIPVLLAPGAVMIFSAIGLSFISGIAVYKIFPVKKEEEEEMLEFEYVRPEL